MKKIIIVAFAAFTGLSSFAQEKKYDVNGYEIGKAPVTTTQTRSESNVVINNNLDANGVDKSVVAVPADASIQSEVIISNQNVDASGMPSDTKIEEPVYNNTVVPDQTGNDNTDYRKAGDIPANTPNPVKETYIRKTAQDIPAETPNVVKETYVRDLSVKEPKAAEQAKVVYDPKAVNSSQQNQNQSAKTTGSATNANATKTAPVNPAGPVLKKQTTSEAVSTKDVKATPPVNPVR